MATRRPSPTNSELLANVRKARQIISNPGIGKALKTAFSDLDPQPLDFDSLLNQIK